MRRSFRFPIFLLAWAATAAPLAHGAPPDSRQAKVAAASANAVEAIKQEIYKIPLQPGVTVRDLLDQTRSEVTLLATLQRAQQIGGPRWLDDQTCQVRLEIDGRRVASALTSVAATHPQTSPIGAQALQPLLAPIESRTFSATGTSTGGATIEAFAAAAPKAPDAWAGVPEPARRQCLATARQNAIQRVVDSLRPVELSPGKTLGAEIDNPQSPVRQQLLAYLQSAPVTGVQFREDRQAEVQIAPSAQDIADTILSAQAGISTTQLVATGTDEARNAQLRDQIAQRLPITVGTASAPPGGQVPRTLDVLVPNRPPEWANGQLDASGTGQVPGNKLKSVRAANNDVRSKFEAQIGPLVLDPRTGLTVADAARRDARLADAIQRALDRARPYKAVYNPDGTVTVYLIMDLHDLWDELRTAG